jgi:hypothetical protein
MNTPGPGRLPPDRERWYDVALTVLVPLSVLVALSALVWGGSFLICHLILRLWTGTANWRVTTKTYVSIAPYALGTIVALALVRHSWEVWQARRAMRREFAKRNIEVEEFSAHSAEQRLTLCSRVAILSGLGTFWNSCRPVGWRKTSLTPRLPMKHTGHGLLQTRTTIPRATTLRVVERQGLVSSLLAVWCTGHAKAWTPNRWFAASRLLLFCVACSLLAAANRTSAAETASSINGPLRQSNNPNYFQDANGAPLILCGSHSWNTLQDWGTDGVVRPVDFDAFVRFLKDHGHNFTLLWYTELPKFRSLPTTETAPPDFTVSPHPWLRTGPGLATDGGKKFDLSQFDQAYFDRLRARVQALNKAGIYAGVYLFTGEWLLRFRCSTDGYPFSGPNNINDLDDGYRGGSAASAISAVTMTKSNAISVFQDAYVRKTVDTLNDLPNVLWIVSEEAPAQSTWWNNHLISLIRAHEKAKPFQHPLGYGALTDAPDSVLYNSDADWVAPSAWLSPSISRGAGTPARKVNVNDSDHSYFGMWNDTPQKNRNYLWENLVAGNQVLFMDPYLVYYPRQKRNLCVSPLHGIGTAPDLRYENFRNNLGYLLRYARKLNLANVTPRSALSSTTFCLAQTPAVGAEYLVYAPAGGAFTVDLSAMLASRTLAVEWFNPATGVASAQHAIPAGSSSQAFRAPFDGDAVLYLVDTAGHR